MSAAVPSHGNGPQPAISIHGVSKIYPGVDGTGVEALRNLSLDIQEGEFISLLGPSGCGKTTLMMIVAGLLPLTSGEVVLGGRSVDRPVTEAGIVFQSPVLLDWRDVIGNVMLQTEARKLPKAQYRQRSRELLERVGLQGFEHHYPWQLSGGMQQRVSLCRALVHDPPYLFMDEPFGALDALTREQNGLDLHKLWYERRKTVIFVTHSIPEAVFLSTRVAVMTPRPGQIEEIFHIDLPFPRRLDLQATAAFHHYISAAQRLFQRHGVLQDN